MAEHGGSRGVKGGTCQPLVTHHIGTAGVVQLLIVLRAAADLVCLELLLEVLQCLLDGLVGEGVVADDGKARVLVVQPHQAPHLELPAVLPHIVRGVVRVVVVATLTAGVGVLAPSCREELASKALGGRRGQEAAEGSVAAPVTGVLLNDSDY